LPFLAAGACGVALVAMVAARTIAAHVTNPAGVKMRGDEGSLFTWFL
jgi:hypothetical protein